MKSKILTLTLAILLTLNLASAVMINSIDVPQLAPGQEGQIRIEIENILTEDVQDVSLSLSFTNLPFIPIGTSEQSVDEIQEDDEENFVFRIKANSNTIPSDYEIPYTLKYEVNGEAKERKGTIGVRVSAQPILTYSIDTENPVEGQKGSVTLRIVNKGFADAKFFSVKVLPDGLTLLSEDEVYIGEVASDDFETATFDVLFNKVNADLTAIIEYKNFDNKLVTETINLPVTVYSKEKALELGIIQPNKVPYYIGGIVLIIILFIIYRSIKKRRRLRRSMQSERK